jgi:SAM-dependent methyltransferase
MTPAPNFDRIAHPYRWLEYLTLGPLLQRTRTHFLHRLQGSRQALILGDGDGRFTALLLATYPQLQAEAVDVSRTMLQLLARRACAPDRLRIHHTDALHFIPTSPPDLIVTHFFLDCLSQPQLDSIVARLTPLTAPHALWLISDFRIPTGPLHLAARLYIRTLYLAFRILTGLRVTQLPDHATPLAAAGFTRIATQHHLFGLLSSELWQR